MGMLDLEGQAVPEISSLDVFCEIRDSDSPHIAIREEKSVDSKEKVREQLRVLFRQKGSDARRRRLHLRARLHDYRKSIRAERLVYYSARTDAVDKSDSFVSFIADGASSE